ncbi:MAG: hypothetical protein MI923_16175 [Phycisphaerales bacterium]|nr:hypothetical protein [Phycisphaerales bacterium]
MNAVCFLVALSPWLSALGQEGDTPPPLISQNQMRLEDLAGLSGIIIEGDPAIGATLYKPAYASSNQVVTRNKDGHLLFIWPFVLIDMDNDIEVGFKMGVAGERFTYYENILFMCNGQPIKLEINRYQEVDTMFLQGGTAELITLLRQDKLIGQLSRCGELYLTVYGKHRRASWALPHRYIEGLRNISECVRILKEIKSTGASLRDVASASNINRIKRDIEERKERERRREEAERRSYFMSLKTDMELSIDAKTSTIGEKTFTDYRIEVLNKSDEDVGEVVIKLWGGKGVPSKRLSFTDLDAGERKHKTIGWAGKKKPKGKIEAVREEEPTEKVKANPGPPREDRVSSCKSCFGRRSFKCRRCRGRGYLVKRGYKKEGEFEKPTSKRVDCNRCGGDGRVSCKRCGGRSYTKRSNR